MLYKISMTFFFVNCHSFVLVLIVVPGSNSTRLVYWWLLLDIRLWYFVFSRDLLVPCALGVWQPLESTDLANTQAIKLSRVLIHVYLCGYCPYGSWYLVSSRDLHVPCVIWCLATIGIDWSRNLISGETIVGFTYMCIKVQSCAGELYFLLCNLSGLLSDS